MKQIDIYLYQFHYLYPEIGAVLLGLTIYNFLLDIFVRQVKCERFVTAAFSAVVIILDTKNIIFS